VRELHAFGHDTKALLPEGVELDSYINR
jgi:hypothetical protein